MSTKHVQQATAGDGTWDSGSGAGEPFSTSFGLAAKNIRAVDLSCRACGACGAGAGRRAWIPVWGPSGVLPQTPI